MLIKKMMFFLIFILHFSVLDCNLHGLRGGLGRSRAVWTPKTAQARSLGCGLDDPWTLVSIGLTYAAVAQSVERVLGKDEVTGSNPISSL